MRKTLLAAVMSLVGALSVQAQSQEESNNPWGPEWNDFMRYSSGPSQTTRQNATWEEGKNLLSRASMSPGFSHPLVQQVCDGDRGDGARREIFTLRRHLCPFSGLADWPGAAFEGTALRYERAGIQSECVFSFGYEEFGEGSSSAR